MIWPKPTSGAGRVGIWLNRLLEASQSRQILPGPGYRIKETPHGVILELDERGGPEPDLCPPTEFTKDKFVNDYGVSKTMPTTTAALPHAEAENTFTETGTIDLGAKRPIGFKNVQARKAWHGRFGFLNKDKCLAVDPTAPSVKYRRVRREATLSGNCWTFVPNTATHTYSLTVLREYEVDRDSGVVTERAWTETADPSVDCLDYADEMGWLKSMARLDYECGHFTAADADALATIAYYGGYPDGEIVFEGLNTGLRVARSVSDTVLTYVVSYDSARDDNVVKPDPYPITWEKTVTVTLSQPYEASDVQDDIGSLLALWDLSDDAQYPWRTDNHQTIAPMVRRDEVSAAVSPDRFEAQGWVDQNKDYTGAVIGQPNAAGYRGWWQAQHWNEVWNGEDWELDSFGAWVPSYLPQNATEWSTKNEAANVFWPGASTEYVLNGICYAQKWAQVILPRQAYDYTRPNLRDRYLVDEPGVRCIDTIAGGTVTILGSDPGWADADVAIVTDSRFEDEQGVWVIERVDGTHYALFEKLEGLPSWWDTEQKQGMIGKCRFYNTTRPTAAAPINSSTPRGDFMLLTQQTEPRASQDETACVQENVDPDGCLPCVLITPNGEDVDGGLTIPLLWCSMDERLGSVRRQFPRMFVDDPFWQAPAAPCIGGRWEEDPGDGTGQYAHRPYVEARCAKPTGAPNLPSGLTLGCMDSPCALPGHVGQDGGEPAEYEGEIGLWIKQLIYCCASAPDAKFVADYRRNGISKEYCP